jgi:hypothetical protein
MLYRNRPAKRTLGDQEVFCDESEMVGSWMSCRRKNVGESFLADRSLDRGRKLSSVVVHLFIFCTWVGIETFPSGFQPTFQEPDNAVKVST